MKYIGSRYHKRCRDKSIEKLALFCNVDGKDRLASMGSGQKCYSSIKYFLQSMNTAQGNVISTRAQGVNTTVEGKYIYNIPMILNGG